MSESDDRIDVRGDGRIILYKREGLKHPKWQARIRVPNSNGYKIVTTKTDNLKEAERFALDAYEDLYLHVKAGGSIKSKTFGQVFEEWERAVTTMGPTRQGGSWEATIERVRSYALEFFGPKKIDTIKQTDFAEFWIWRKGNYSRRPPSNATLRRERTSLLPVFKFAVSKGYIAEVPETNPPKAATERRPTFTLDEWRVIVRKARQWVAEGKQKAVFRDRLVSQQCFLILANTGMRIGELRTLRWGDLRTVNTESGTRLVAHVRGKTGAREVVFQEGADAYVKRLYDLQREELGKDPERNGLVVCHRDGIADPDREAVVPVAAGVRGSPDHAGRDGEDDLLAAPLLRHAALVARHQSVPAGEADGNLGGDAGEVLRPDRHLGARRSDHQGEAASCAREGHVVSVRVRRARGDS